MRTVKIREAENVSAKSNRYRRIPGSNAYFVKQLLVESPYITLPKGAKRWMKKYLSRRERRQSSEKNRTGRNDEE